MRNITLEEAWNLLESLNEDANQRAKSFWLNGNINKAIEKQSTYFKSNFLNLDNETRCSIVHWINTDDEFQDYFKCLSGDE